MTGAATRTGTAAGVLLATCLSTLIVNANTSAVSILLPAISADTGTSVTVLQWAVTGYSLVGAAVIITSGSLGDVFGRRRVFQMCLLLFVASCILIALAQSGAAVIVGRVIQGAAGATILACGLSLLSVANEGDSRLRAVSLWGAAAAVGAAAGPLVGGVLVEVTGWQGLFWIDAALAVCCIVITAMTVGESRDPDRPRSIDYAGTVLIAVCLMALILGVTWSGEKGWFSALTLGCFALSALAGYAFIIVERRVAVPLLDLALLRNRLLVGCTIAILIGAGTINALMYLLSLYFQDPATLDMSPLEAGIATLPATVGLVVASPFIPRLAKRFGGRQTIGAGFLLATAGFVVVGFAEGTWKYAAFLVPLIAIAIGMALTNGPSSAAATSSVPENQVGGASGVSNMARYVGAAVATALAATIYASVSLPVDGGQASASSLAEGLAAASWIMAGFSALGLALAIVVIRRHPAGPVTAQGAAAAAAAGVHTLPTGAPAAGTDRAPVGE